MSKEEIENYIEEQIAFHCDEFGLRREEATEVVLLNCIEYYKMSELSKEDLAKCADYLDHEIEIE